MTGTEDTAKNKANIASAALKEVPMRYLHSGTRFVAVRNHTTGFPRYLSGVTDMDGHSVSPHYGFRAGNDYYLDPERNYINVKLDGQEYSFRLRRVNDTLFERDGWRFWVTSDVHAQYREDVELNKWGPEAAKRDERKATLLKQIAELKREVEAL